MTECEGLIDEIDPAGWGESDRVENGSLLDRGSIRFTNQEGGPRMRSCALPAGPGR